MPDAVKTLYWWGYENTVITPSNYKPDWTGASFTSPTINKNTNSFSATLGNAYGDIFYLNDPIIQASDITFNAITKADNSGMDNLFAITKAYQNNYSYPHSDPSQYGAPNATTMTKYSARYNDTFANAIPFMYINNGTLNVYALWYE